MTFWSRIGAFKRWRRGLLAGSMALSLGACATTRSGMSSAPKQELDASGRPIIQAGDVAIAGQLVAHSIMDLPEVADAEKPPLVRFSGVTSQVTGPIDTEPYTTLLRDRLLLLTREKLRFVERQLPAFKPHKIKHQKDLPPPVQIDTDADYQIMAQLGGNYDADTYLLRVEFVDLHSNQPLFDGEYRIAKEAQNSSAGTTTETTQQIEPTNPNPSPEDGDVPPPPPPQPMPQGDSGLQ